MDGLKVALIYSSDDDLRKLLAQLLNRAGISFIFEQDQSSILLRLLDLDVRVVILDLDTDNVTGVDFLRLIKRLRPRVPAIVIIPANVEEIEDRLLEAGAMMCIAKKQVEDADKDQYLDMLHVLMQTD